MPIEEIAAPIRTRTRASMFTDDDVTAAAAALEAIAETGEANGRAVKHGVYTSDDGDPKHAENLARSAGNALARAIEAKTGKAWRVSAWTDGDGDTIGALLPKPRVKRQQPQQRQPQPQPKPKPKPKTFRK